MIETLKNKIFSGLFWKFGERIIAQGVSFAVSVVLSRKLMPSDYGTIAIVWIFISIANVFVTSGFSTALVQKKDADEVDFSTNFYCSLIASVGVYILMYFFAPFIATFYKQKGLTNIIRVFSLRIPLSAFSAIQHAYVERKMLFKRFFFSTLLGTILSGIVGIIMAYSGFGVWALIAQYFTNTIVDIVVLLATIPWRPRLLFSKTAAKNMMGYGSKILFADLSGTFFDQLRSLIIGRIYTPSDLAFYNKGNQLPNLITTNITASVMTVLFPAISSINSDENRVKTTTKKSTEMMSYIIMPLLFGLACISKPLINILYTSKWEQSIPFIQILSISNAIGLIGSISLQTIKAVGRSDIVLNLELYKKPIYFILLIVGALISPLAVAVTMLIYTICGTLINAFQLSKVIDYPIREQLVDLGKPIILCIVMSIVIYPITFLKINYFIMVVLQIVVGVFVYILLSVFSNNDSFSAILTLIKERNYDLKKNN